MSADLDAAWASGTPVTPDEWDAAAPVGVGDDAESNAFLKRSFGEAFKGDAEKKASILKLATDTGAGADFVERQFDTLKTSWEASRFDAAAWRKANPELARTVLSNVRLAPIVLRDEKIGPLTQALRTADAVDVGRRAEIGADLAGSAAEHLALPWYERAAQGFLRETAGSLPSPVEVRRAQETLARVRGEIPPAQVPTVEDARAAEGKSGGTLSRAALTFQDARLQAEANGEAFAVMVKDLAGGDTWDREKHLADLESQIVPRDYGGEGVLDALAVDAASVLASGAESMGAGTVAGVGVGLATRSAKAGSLAAKSASSLATFRQEAGSAVRDYRKVRTEDGKPLAKDVVYGAALAYGLLSTAVETASFGATGRALGPMGEAFATGGGKAYLAKLLGESGFRRLAARTARAWAERSVTEGAEEFAQTVLQDVVLYEASQGAVQPDGTLEKAVGAGKAALSGSLLLGAGGTVVSTGFTKALHARSQAQARAIAEAADSPTARASPAALADLIARETAAGGEAVTHLYVDPVKAVEAGAPVDPQAARDAIAAGGKLEVPVEEFVGKWAPAVGDKLNDHVATRPGYMTVEEAKGQEEVVAQEAQAIAAEPVSDIPAVEAAVASQAERMGISALPAELFGDEANAYLEAQAKAKGSAARRAELAIKKDALREKQAAWKDEEATEREKAGAEYDALPARRAALWLRGKVQEEDGTVTPVAVPKLDLEAVRGIVGDQAKLFPTAKRGGIHPDDMAALVGYDSGQAMLEAVAALPEREGWIKQTAVDRMRERHPSLLEDMGRLRAEVAKGLHKDESSRWLLKEIAALGRKAGDGVRVTVEALREAAKLQVERAPIGTLNPHLALTRERGAANRKAIAAAKGEWGRALTYAQQQLLNMHLWRELDAARDERDGFLGLASDLGKAKAIARLGKASPTYRDGVGGLLAVLGLGPPGPPVSVEQITAQMEADGATVMLDPEQIGALLAQPRGWKTLTVAEMRQVEAALKNMRAAARGRTTATVEGKRVDREEHAALLANTAFQNRKDRGPVSSSVDTESDFDVGRSYGQAFDALLLRIETMAHWLDGGKDGPWFRALVLPFQEGKVEENDLLEKTFKPITDAFEAMTPAMRKLAIGPIDGNELFPNHPSGEIAAPRRLIELMVLSLYAGNEGGLQRLEAGRHITKAEMDAAMAKHFTKEIMDWRQAVLDAADSLKEPSFALEERDSGVRPKETKPVPTETQWGTYRGGHFPNIYDRRPGAPTSRQVALGQGDLFDRTFPRPGTNHGHLKTRVEFYDGILSASTAGIYQHIAQVVHDITFRERVKSVGGLLMEPEVDRALRRTLGEERAKQFLAWAQRVGQMRGNDAAAHLGKLNRLVGQMRGNVAVSFLGYRPRIGLADLANFPVALATAGVDPGYLAAAVAELSGDTLKAGAETVASLSPQAIELKAWAFESIGELRVMQNQWRREYSRMLRKFTKRRIPAVAEVKEHAFVFMETSFVATAVPIATAVYRKAEAAGASKREAEIAANRALREVFPSHSPVDQSALLADRGFWGYAALFMGYLNVIYQRGRDIVEPVLQAEGFRQYGGRLAAASGAAAALLVSYGLFGEFLMGHGKEDDETWLEWAVRKSITQAVAPVPFVNEAVGMVERNVLGKQSSPRSANPFLMIGEAWVRLAMSAADEDADAERTFKAAAGAIGITFGIPRDPFVAQGPYLLDAATGEAEVRNPLDVAEGLVYGNRPGQPANPFSVLSDLIEGD